MEREDAMSRLAQHAATRTATIPFFFVRSPFSSSGPPCGVGEGCELRVLDPSEAGLEPLRDLQSDSTLADAVVAIEGLHPQFDQLHALIRRLAPSVEILVIYPRLSAMKQIFALPADESTHVRFREYWRSREAGVPA